MEALGFTVNPIKLETGLRPNSAGIPYTLLFRIEAIGFPTFRRLLYSLGFWGPFHKGSYYLGYYIRVTYSYNKDPTI